MEPFLPTLGLFLGLLLLAVAIPAWFVHTVQTTRKDSARAQLEAAQRASVLGLHLQEGAYVGARDGRRVELHPLVSGGMRLSVQADWSGPDVRPGDDASPFFDGAFRWGRTPGWHGLHGELRQAMLAASGFGDVWLDGEAVRLVMTEADAQRFGDGLVALQRVAEQVERRPTLEEVVREDPEPELRVVALRWLAKAKPEGAKQLARDLDVTLDSSPELFAECARLLGDSSAVDALLRHERHVSLAGWAIAGLESASKLALLQADLPAAGMLRLVTHLPEDGAVEAAAGVVGDWAESRARYDEDYAPALVELLALARPRLVPDDGAWLRRVGETANGLAFAAVVDALAAAEGLAALSQLQEWHEDRDTTEERRALSEAIVGLQKAHRELGGAVSVAAVEGGVLSEAVDPRVAARVASQRRAKERS